jgi:hypothetical protein
MEERMDYKKWLPELKACPIFDDLHDSEIVSSLEELAPEIVHFQKDDAILTKNEAMRGFGVFLNSVPPQQPVRRKEKWRYPGVCTPGWIFAELPGFSDKHVAAFTFKAPVECHIMFIDADRFVGYCTENTRAHQLLIRNQFGVYARKCIALKRARRFFALGDVIENVALFLWDQMNATGAPQFLPERDAEELAEMMMIDEEKILAAYKELADKGIIAQADDGAVSILNKDTLEKAAGSRVHVKLGH